MKKISKFIKNNYKFLIGVIVGLLLSGTGVYAANTIYSKNVTYDNSNSGLSATNVQDALDETYTKCFPPVLATKKIIDLYNDGSSINTVNIGGSTSNTQVKLNSTQGIMLDNNGDYRYYGANPNNYVIFNDETWRIIGAFNNVDDGTGKKEMRLKIIRDESIGDYSYDSNSTVNGGYGINDWSDSDLMTELNDLYYNSKSGICYNGRNDASITCNFTNIGLNSTARNMINNAIYYLGAIDSIRAYHSLTSCYEEERSVSTFDCTDYWGPEYVDSYCPRATTWIGKIGIMYPSDYGYATNLSLCPVKYLNKYSTSSLCINNNWLFNGNAQWTITPGNRDGFQTNIVNSSGDTEEDPTSGAYAVRPVVYLKSNIGITIGDGTSSNPYKLSLS